MTKKGRESLWVAFKFERLPTLCFNCGRLGHMAKFCDRPRGQEAGAEGFGPWIRAENNEFIRDGCQGSKAELQNLGRGAELGRRNHAQIETTGLRRDESRGGSDGYGSSPNGIQKRKGDMGAEKTNEGEGSKDEECSDGEAGKLKSREEKTEKKGKAVVGLSGPRQTDSAHERTKEKSAQLVLGHDGEWAIEWPEIRLKDLAVKKKKGMARVATKNVRLSKKRAASTENGDGSSKAPKIARREEQDVEGKEDMRDNEESESEFSTSAAAARQPRRDQ